MVINILHYLSLHLALADGILSSDELKYLINEYGHNELDLDIDFDDIRTLSENDKLNFLNKLYEIVVIDNVVKREELQLLSLIAASINLKYENFNHFFEKACDNDKKLSALLCKNFKTFLERNPQYKSEEKIESINLDKFRVLIYGCSDKLFLDEIQIIELFNEELSDRIEENCTKHNFVFYIDKDYKKVKKLSKNMFKSLRNNQFDAIIIGARPHKVPGGSIHDFVKKYNSEALFIDITKESHNQTGFTKNLLRKYIRKIIDEFIINIK